MILRRLAPVCFRFAGAVPPALTARCRRAAIRFLAQAVLLGTAGLAFAQETVTAAPDAAGALVARREGYAFDNPRILAQQRLFGVAHGVSLLAGACMDLPDHLDATLNAYMPWRDSQEATVAAAQSELARHYFGERASEAQWLDLVRALKLKPRLELALDSPELKAACETLPDVLRRPRYKLGRQLELQGMLVEATAGLEAEVRRENCRAQLEGDALRLFDVRYDTWRDINVLRLARVQAALKAEWPVEGPAESLAQWEAALRGDTRMRGSEADCLAFSETLKRPDAALRTMFAPQGTTP